MDEAGVWHRTPPEFAGRLWRRIKADVREVVSRAGSQPAGGSR
jgi:hypothetical protein